MYRILLRLPDTICYGVANHDGQVITLADRATADAWARLFLLRYDADQVEVVDVSAELAALRSARLAVEHQYAAAYRRLFGQPRPEPETAKPARELGRREVGWVTMMRTKDVTTRQFRLTDAGAGVLYGYGDEQILEDCFGS